MKQRLQQKWQHSPSKNQVSKTPVKEVQMSLDESSDSQLTATDLMGLSWTLFEWEDDY